MMTEFRLNLWVSDRVPSRVRKELKQLLVRFDWSTIGIMQLKGFKYIPTLLYTGWSTASGFSAGSIRLLVSRMMSLPLSYFEEIDKTFDSLRHKVDIRIKKEERWESALWPSEILDLKEVQDEVNWLTKRDLLLKKDLEDRRLAEKILPDFWIYDEKLTLDEKIDKVIEIENKWGKELGNFFSKTFELHTKCPDAKFWFHVYSL